MAGGIDVSNAAYCWIKDVQTDGTMVAREQRLALGGFRSEPTRGHVASQGTLGFTLATASAEVAIDDEDDIP